MKDKTWYACEFRHDFLGFKKGEIAYIRKAMFKEPLAAGSFCIIFRSKDPHSIRLFDDVVHDTVALLPNKWKPKAAPEGSNEVIEGKYREWLKANPPTPRHPLAERLRIMAMRQERMPSALQGAYAS